jgi:uncharacterized protein
MLFNATSLPIILSFIGLFIGGVQALAGAGGGILALPLLLLVTGMSIQSATPIALMAVAVSAGIATLIALPSGQVRYKAALLMALFGWLASPFGVWLAHRISSNVLIGLFALLMLRNALTLWQRPQARSQLDALAAGMAPPDCPCRLNPSTGRLRWTWPCAKEIAQTGVLAGFLSGLLGVSGGFIIVPSLSRQTDLPMQAIVGTSLMVISLIALVSVGNSSLWNAVAWDIATPFVLGAVVGGLGMRLAAHKIPQHWVARSFAGMCAAMAVMLLVRSVHALWAQA